MIENCETRANGRVLEWWQAVLLASGMFFAGVLILGVLSFFVHKRLAALIMEVGIYLIPAAVTIRMLKLDSAGVGRIRRLAHVRLLIIIPVAGLGYAAAVTPLVELTNSLYPIPRVIVDALVKLMLANSVPEFIWVAFLVAIVPAVSEEILFRGIVQPAMIARFGVNTGIALTAVMFATIHMNPWSFGPLLILGTFFGIVSYKIGTFWAGALAHLGNNLLAVSTLFYVGKIDYESLTEATPWYIFVPGLIAAVGGTILIVRSKLPEADTKVAGYSMSDDVDGQTDTIQDGKS